MKNRSNTFNIESYQIEDTNSDEANYMDIDDIQNVWCIFFNLTLTKNGAKIHNFFYKI